MPATRNSNELSIDQIQAILNNDRVRQHLIRTGYIDQRGNLTRKAEDNHHHQSRRPLTANVRRSQPVSMVIPSRRFVIENARSRSPESSTNNRRLKSASTNRSKTTNQSFDSTRARNVLLRRAVSPQILQPDNRCTITLTYYGPELNIEYDRGYFEAEGDEILLMQQHCGGENFLAFKGFLKPNDVFYFNSRRHSGYPFALAFYVNGVIKDRLSVCCEFRCKDFMRIGGKSCLVAITKVENARACRRCRFEQRMKTLMEGLPRPATTIDRRYRRKPDDTRKSTSKPLPALNSTNGKKGDDKSNSKSPDFKSKHRPTSADSSESDAVDSKPKPIHNSTSKRSDSGTSTPESPIPPSHKRPSDADKNHSTGGKKPDVNSSNVASFKTKKIPPPIAKEVDSDTSDTNPPVSHVRPSESPKQVDSLSSSPEPSGPLKKFPMKKKDRVPTPEPVDTDLSDTDSPVPNRESSNTNGPRESSPSIPNHSSNIPKQPSKIVDSFNMHDSDSEERENAFNFSHQRKSSDNLPSGSSKTDLKTQPPKLPVEIETVDDDSDTD